MRWQRVSSSAATSVLVAALLSCVVVRVKAQPEFTKVLDIEVRGAQLQAAEGSSPAAQKEKLKLAIVIFR